MATKRKLPDHIYARAYKTRDGRKRELYYVQFTDWKGIRRTFPAGDDLKVAMKLRSKRMEQHRLHHDFDQEEGQKPWTVSAWITHWLTLHTHKASRRQDVLRAQYVSAFFGATLLTQIKASQIEQYKQHRLDGRSRYQKAPAPASINRELALLRSVLRLAAKDDLIRKVPDIRLFAEQNQRTRVLSPEEFQAVADMLPDGMTEAWLLAGFLGLRISEAIHLTWGRVDHDHRILTIERTENKERKTKEIPLGPSAVAVLSALWIRAEKHGPRDRVFWYNKKPLTYDQFSHRFRDHVVPALGLHGVWVHDLRGTFITTKTAQRWDRQLIKAITGHRTDTAFNRYLRPSMELLRQVVADELPTQPPIDVEQDG